MKENTQEKKMIERNKNSIVDKIKKFFRKIFYKKEKNIKEIVEEVIRESEEQNNSNFKENLKIFELNEEKLLDIQQKYRNGEINKRELTDEQIEKLCELYDKQIAELQESIEIKIQKLAEYKRKNKPKVEKKNA